jgi:hypothetical protein
MPSATLPRLTTGCPIKSFPAQHPQAINTIISPDNHIAAITTIATIGTTEGNMLLPPEADYAGTPPTCSDLYLRSIKHYNESFLPIVSHLYRRFTITKQPRVFYRLSLL